MKKILTIFSTDGVSGDKNFKYACDLDFCVVSVVWSVLSL
jgi:hypothetical protein